MERKYCFTLKLSNLTTFQFKLKHLKVAVTSLEYIPSGFLLGSVAEVERVWSISKHLLGDVRNYFSPLMLQTILFLRFNERFWDIKLVAKAIWHGRTERAKKHIEELEAELAVLVINDNTGEQGGGFWVDVRRFAVDIYKLCDKFQKKCLFSIFNISICNCIHAWQFTCFVNIWNGLNSAIIFLSFIVIFIVILWIIAICVAIFKIIAIGIAIFNFIPIFIAVFLVYCNIFACFWFVAIFIAIFFIIAIVTVIV